MRNKRELHFRSWKLVKMAKYSTKYIFRWKLVTRLPRGGDWHLMQNGGRVELNCFAFLGGLNSRSASLVSLRLSLRCVVFVPVYASRRSRKNTSQFRSNNRVKHVDRPEVKMAPQFCSNGQTTALEISTATTKKDALLSYLLPVYETMQLLILKRSCSNAL